MNMVTTFVDMVAAARLHRIRKIWRRGLALIPKFALVILAKNSGYLQCRQIGAPEGNLRR